MKLYLVRHGESEANMQGIYSGFLDTKLTKKGERQARECYELLKHITFDKVICSDLQRAYKTACIVSAISEEKIIVREGLREMNFGNWEGLSHKQILESDKEYYEKWMEDYYKLTTPEGESLNTFYERVNSEFDIIKKEYLFKISDGTPPSLRKGEKEKEKNILVVSHSGVIRALLSKEILASMEGYWKFAIDNCSVTVIEYDEKEYAFLKNLNYSGRI
ncbi:MAG: histidine phosphatase family protein [Acidaminobacteraceae bacterium]